VRARKPHEIRVGIAGGCAAFCMLVPPRLFEIEIDSAGWKRRRIVNASGAAARTRLPTS